MSCSFGFIRAALASLLLDGLLISCQTEPGKLLPPQDSEPSAQQTAPAVARDRDREAPLDAQAVTESGRTDPGKATTLLDAARVRADAALDGGAAESARPDAENTTSHDAAAQGSDAGVGRVGARFPPFETHGEPLVASDRVWTYVSFPESRCRDGSPAGISLSLNRASKKVLIYLEGGVYCFDDLTCAINPANVDDTLFNAAKTAPTRGIFDPSNERNPVRDWNIVYVPYCTGDAMGGTKTEPTDVPGGPKRQYFSGHLNMQKFLQRIVPTFPDATDVLLTGMSAGGSAVLQNLLLVQRAFPVLKVRHINDSSLPPVSSATLPECLQDKFRNLWGIDQGDLSYCGDRCPNRSAYWQDYVLFLASEFADRPAGFIDALEDSMMRSVCAAGNNECTGSLLFDSVPEEQYRSELMAFRAKLSDFPNYGTFFPSGTQHTWLRDDSFYAGKAGTLLLVDWFARIARGEPGGNAGG